MARVSRKFSEDFDLVTSTWIARRDMWPEEVEAMRARLRVALSPGPGLPAPVDADGVPLKGWVPMSHEQRIAAHTETFSRLADEIRRDIARSERIKAERHEEKRLAA